MNVKTAEQALELITTSEPDPAVRIAFEMEIGMAQHQGDIYVHRVEDDHPRGKLLGTRQLAIGQGEGSRHMAEGDGIEVYEGVKLPKWVTEPEWVEPGALLGPVVVAPERWRNTHPVHAHHDLPCGVYQVTYQADATTRKRVVD